MITAKEARHIAVSPLEEKVQSLCESIERLAKDKKRMLRTGYDHKEDDELWQYGGYNRTEEWKAAKKMLEDLGYTVSFDMYTKVEW